MYLFRLVQFAVGSGQTGPDEGATEGPEVPHRGGVLETADLLCQWYMIMFVYNNVLR